MGYQSVGNLPRRHRGCRRPQHVQRAPIERPALEPRIALVAALRGDAASNVKAGLELQHSLDLHHGRFDLDASVPVLRELARQFGMKLGQRENGLFRFDFGVGHPAKIGRDRSNYLWRLRHNTGRVHLVRRQYSVGLATIPLDDDDRAVANSKFASKQFWHLLRELRG